MSLNTQQFVRSGRDRPLRRGDPSLSIAGGIDPDRFTAIRLQQGVYGQRQQGVNMLRIKMPGGRLNAVQLDVIADVAEEFSQHRSRIVTTRQSIQMHYIPLMKMPIGDAPSGQGRHDHARSMRQHHPQHDGVPVGRRVPERARGREQASGWRDRALPAQPAQPADCRANSRFRFSGCESDCAQSLLHDAA